MVTVHLTPCHINAEQQTYFTKGEGNVEEKEKKKTTSVQRNSSPQTDPYAISLDSEQSIQI